MIDPARSPDEFEQKVRHTPDIARLETERNPDDTVTQNALYYRAYLSADIAHRMQNADDPFGVIESIDRRIRNLGAHEVKIEDAELLIAYKHDN